MKLNLNFIPFAFSWSWRFMNLSYYPIDIQLITYQYTLMGYELGNILKRTLFDCQ